MSESEGTPRLKRRRSSSISSASEAFDDDLAASTPHPDLWFDDGSIIIIAGSVSFCVHRSNLCTHSTVFADMFGVPQPADQARSKGCPILKIPDSEEDMSCLLKALYNPLYYFCLAFINVCSLLNII